MLWPLVLAPFHAAGADGARTGWPAWLLSYAALFGLAREIEALTRPLCGLTIAFGAGALALAFGGFAWGAGSGMEAVPFAYLIALTVRLGAEWSERAPSLRTGRAMLPVLAAALALAFCRPEGALFVVAVAVVVCVYPPLGRRLYRLSALAPLVIAAAPSLVLLALTGSTTSSTAQAKLLALNPYYSVWSGSLANARLLVDTILQGEAWGAEYLPRASATSRSRPSRQSPSWPPRAGGSPEACSCCSWRRPSRSRARTRRSSGTGSDTSGPSPPGGSSGARASRGSSERSARACLRACASSGRRRFSRRSASSPRASTA